MDRGAWQATHSSWGHRESDTTEQIALSYFSVLLREVFRLRGRVDTTEWKCEVGSEEVGGVGAGEGGWPQGINVPE